jgi:hypothetical protein
MRAVLRYSKQGLQSSLSGLDYQIVHEPCVNARYSVVAVDHLLTRSITLPATGTPYQAPRLDLLSPRNPRILRSILHLLGGWTGMQSIVL